MPEIGITLGSSISLAAMMDLVKESERRGLDFLALGEGVGRSVFPELVAFAQVTSRVRLMTMIISTFTRSFIPIAAGIAVVDTISNGRAALGLGSSIPHIVEDQHGIKYERPAQRMKEYVQIIRQLLAKRAEERIFVDVVSGGVNYQGEIFQIRGATIDAEPVQEHLPIYVAAVGPRMLQIAGEVADGVIIEYISPGYVEKVHELLAAGARRAGRDASQLDVIAFMLVSVADSSKQAIEAVKPVLALHAAFSIYDLLWETAGYLEAALRVREFYLKGDLEGAAHAVSDEMVQAVTIAGTKEECRRELGERVEALAAQGVSGFAFYPPVQANMEPGYRSILEVVDALN